MSLPDKCPFCDAGPGQYLNSYLCGTFLRPNVANRVHQTKMCIVSERARLAARVAELEAWCKRLEEAARAVYLDSIASDHPWTTNETRNMHALRDVLEAKR